MINFAIIFNKIIAKTKQTDTFLKKLQKPVDDFRPLQHNYAIKYRYRFTKKMAT